MKYLRLHVCIISVIVAGFAMGCSGSRSQPAKQQPSTKINGISFEAPRDSAGLQSLDTLVKTGANWVAIIPFAMGRSGAPQLTFNHDRQWWGETARGVRQTIERAHALGLKVMLKPQVWVRGDGWTGDFSLPTEAEWQQWEARYRQYIMNFAGVAQAAGAELYCVGTELRLSARERPSFWRGLIDSVRNEFNGSLTYAANWDNYKHVRFWDDLDYIGVDAYFPLSGQATPTADSLDAAWAPIKKELAAVAQRYDRPLLFTEWGYRSVDHAADAHWLYEGQRRTPNEQAQARAYEAVRRNVRDAPWFAGGFLWEWTPATKHWGNAATSYSPEGKAAEQVLRKWFGNRVK